MKRVHEKASTKSETSNDNVTLDAEASHFLFKKPAYFIVKEEDADYSCL